MQEEATVWTITRRLKIFSIDSLTAETVYTEAQIKRLVVRWAKARALELVRIDADRRKWWGIRPEMTDLPTVNDGQAQRVRMAGNPAESPPTPHRNMWRYMLRNESFSPVDVAAASNTPTVVVSVDDARTYCQLLARFAYLAVVKKARPGVVEARYRLIRKTGPEAPQPKRIGVIVDPNLGEIIYPEGVQA
jgi:hypothetical protein